MHIVTGGDAAFFRFMKNLERSVRRHGHHLHVYDLGLTARQRAALASPVRRTPFPADAFEHNATNNIKTTHKVVCLREFLLAFRTDCLYLDGDTLLVASLTLDEMLQGADLAVTRRHPREQKPHLLRNGIPNAGVMAFRYAQATLDFLDRWEEACARPEATDQSALSDLLEAAGVDWHASGPQACGDLRVTVLDGETYNDVTCRTGKIFHFKSAARRWNKYLFYALFCGAQRLAPGLVRRLVAENARRRLWVWKPKRARGASPAGE